MALQPLEQRTPDARYQPRVLICDDSPVVRRLLRVMLEAEAFEVTAVESGEKAFEKSLVERFDLIVSDVQMGRISGVQLCRLLRRDPATSDTPFVLLTSADDPRSRFWGQQAGADAYISKENMQQELLPSVQKLLPKDLPPRSSRPAAKALRSVDPIARLSEVLDEHLFEAVVSAEIRGLVEYAEDRDRFAAELFQRCEATASYAYLVLQLHGPAGPTVHLHALQQWPLETDASAASALGVDAVEPSEIRATRTAEPPCRSDEIRTGELALFPLVLGSETFGSLSVYGGRKRLAQRDRQTLALIAQELVVLVRSLFLYEHARKLARVDSLTGLYNRRTADERLRHEVARAQRYGHALSVVLVDVDHFKSVNDGFGHPAGDRVLKQVADVLSGGLRNIDLSARWGGEEFFLILPDTDRDGAHIACERLRLDIATTRIEKPGPDQVTVSMGVGVLRKDDTCEGLLKRADDLMYEAKRAGRNRVMID